MHIGMCFLFDIFTDFIDWIDCTRFIIDIHNGYDCRIFIHCILNLLQRYLPCRIYRKICHAIAKYFFHLSAAVQNGRMFYICCNNMFFVLICKTNAFNCGSVGFTWTRSKNDIRSLHSQKPGDCSTGFFHHTVDFNSFIINWLRIHIVFL